jgi:hypothetical protein
MLDIVDNRHGEHGGRGQGGCDEKEDVNNAINHIIIRMLIPPPWFHVGFMLFSSSMFS